MEETTEEYALALQQQAVFSCLDRLVTSCEKRLSVLNVQTPSLTFESFKKRQQDGSHAFPITSTYAPMSNAAHLGTVDSFHKLHERDSVWAERSTYRLITTLYQDRCRQPDNTASFPDPNWDLNVNIGRSQVLKAALDADSVFRELKILRSWSEECEPLPDVIVSAVNFSRSVGINKEGHQHDPDSIRASPHTSHADKQADEQLVKLMWECIRRGEIERAYAMAKRGGDPWRAASILGQIPYSDTRLSFHNSFTQFKLDGNKNYKLFARVVENIVEGNLMPSQYERGLYATLVGYLPGIVPCCNTWEDFMWAHTVEAVHKRENELIDRLPSSFKPDSQPVGDLLIEMNPIIRLVKNVEKRVVSNHFASLYHQVRQQIILHDISGVLDTLNERSKGRDIVVKRFAAHIAIILYRLSKITNCRCPVVCQDNLVSLIVERYVRYLMDDEPGERVAQYTACIPDVELQNVVYADYLRQISETDVRSRALDHAAQYKLSTDIITENVVEATMRTTDTDKTRAVTSTATADDMQKIRSLEWLCLNSQPLKALEYGNSLARAFIANDKLQPAREVYSLLDTWLESFMIQSKKALHAGLDVLAGNTYDSELKDTLNAMREHNCINIYLKAIDVWAAYERTKANQPQEPTLRPRVRFSDGLINDNATSKYTNDKNEWVAKMKQLSDEFIAILLGGNNSSNRPMFGYPSGFLADSFTDAVISDRLQQLQTIRTLCIPICFSRLLDVLQDRKDYDTCLKLVPELVQNRPFQYNWYECFTQQDLQRVMHQYKQCRLAMIDSVR